MTEYSEAPAETLYQDILNRISNCIPNAEVDGDAIKRQFQPYHTSHQRSVSIQPDHGLAVEEIK